MGDGSLARMQIDSQYDPTKDFESIMTASREKFDLRKKSSIGATTEPDLLEKICNSKGYNYRKNLYLLN